MAPGCARPNADLTPSRGRSANVSPPADAGPAVLPDWARAPDAVEAERRRRQAIGDDVLRNVVRGHFKELRKCFDRWSSIRASKETRQQKLETRFTIRVKPLGLVVSKGDSYALTIDAPPFIAVAADGDLGDEKAQAANCMKDAASKWTFPDSLTTRAKFSWTFGDPPAP
jgi:hypothetical protein